MSYIILSKNIYANLVDWLNISDNALDIHKFLLVQKDFAFIITSIKKLLSEEKYVVLKNTPFCTKEHLEAFVRCFGDYYGKIEHTGIKIDCTYTGCASSKLILHNDDAIDLESQPNVGFIQVVKKDPLLRVSNGIVVLRDLIQKLRYEDSELLDELLNTDVPMLSLGVNYEAEDKAKISIKSPILYKENNHYKVRFDYSRIKFYYQYNGFKQPDSEGRMIYKFLQHCESLKKEVVLETGDILIHDNKSTLHDRSESSIGIDVGSNLFSREIFVSFAS